MNEHHRVVRNPESLSLFSYMGMPFPANSAFIPMMTPSAQAVENGFPLTVLDQGLNPNATNFSNVNVKLTQSESTAES